MVKINDINKVQEIENEILEKFSGISKIGIA